MCIPNLCKSHTLKCGAVSKVKGQWFSFSPGSGRTGPSQTLLWVINTSAVSFLPLRGESGCTLLIFHSESLTPFFFLSFLHRQTEEGNERVVVKDGEWIKEEEEKGRARARWAPSQSIYQTQCGPSPPLPAPPCCSHVLNPHVIL